MSAKKNNRLTSPVWEGGTNEFIVPTCGEKIKKRVVILVSSETIEHINSLRGIIKTLSDSTIGMIQDKSEVYLNEE